MSERSRTGGVLVLVLAKPAEPLDKDQDQDQDQVGNGWFEVGTRQENRYLGSSDRPCRESDAKNVAQKSLTI